LLYKTVTKQQNYFTYLNNAYQQMKGTANGSPISNTLTDFYNFMKTNI